MVTSELIPKRQGWHARLTESRAWRIAERGVMESRAWRIAEREIPGGERHGERSGSAEPAVGVAGIVSSGVTLNRHRLPTKAEGAHSSPGELDELSSSPEALPKPTSVVSSSSSCKSGSFKSILATGSLAAISQPRCLPGWM